MKTCAVIVAGGSGVRFGGDIPKQFRDVCGRPILSWTIRRFETTPLIDSVVVVVPEEHLLFTSERVVDPFAFRKVIKIVNGGSTRQESVLKGLKALPASTDFVAIHDGARPMVRTEDIEGVIAKAQQDRAAVLAAPAADALNRCKDGFIISTIDRTGIYRAQTPQVFQYDLIKDAHEEAANNNTVLAADDSLLIEEKGFKVTIVESTGPNPKVTTASDLYLVEALLRKEIDG